jgi:hypothetical protein
MARLKLTRLTPVLLLTAACIFVACSDDEGGTSPTTNTTGGSSGSGGSTASGATGGMSTLTGGSTGTGGTVMAPKTCTEAATGDMPIIDDFDDDTLIDKFVPNNEGRNGWWEAFEDDVGTFGGKVDFSTGEGQGVDGSNGRCVELTGHDLWGAVIAVNMGYPRCMYDASVYEGICFDAKGEIVKGEALEFSLNTADTLGSPDGGRCDAPDCVKFYHYKTTLRDEDSTPAVGEVLLSPTEYRTFCFKWEDLRQAKDAPTPFAQNTEEVVQFEWKWPGGWPTGEVDANGNDIPGSTDGTLCVDNVRFMTREAGSGGAGGGGAGGGGAGGAAGGGG